MKINLVTKVTILVLFIFLVTAFLIQILIHTQVRGIIESQTDQAYALYLQSVLDEINDSRGKLQSSSTGGLPPGLLQKSVLDDLRQHYLRSDKQNSYIFVVDEQGAVILHPRLASGDRSLAGFFAAFPVADATNKLLYRDATGTERWAIMAQLPQWRWIVCYSIPLHIKEAAFREFHNRLSLIMVGAFISMGLLLTYSLSKMLKPVSRLTRAAHAIADGNLEHPIDTSDTAADEIGTLAKAFNRMQQALNSNITQLKKSEFKYRSLVQYANSVILRWDKNGRVIFLNEFGQKLFGFRQEEIVGKNVVGTIIAEQGATGLELTRMIDDILQNPRKYVVNEKENICRDGRRVWIQWSNNAIVDEQENFLEMLSVGIDITEQKATEKRLTETKNRYRALFESAGDAILILSEEGKCIDCNPKALELFGCSKKELTELFPDQITPIEEYVNLAAVSPGHHLVSKASSGEHQFAEWQITRADGKKRDVKSSINRFNANSRQYIQIVLSDITQQKRMENKLHQAQKMEGIGALAGGIAHDFNNILSAIIGYTELALMKADDSPELTKDLKQVRKASERAKELVRQILSFSRKDKQKKSVLQVSLVVKEALKLLRSSIPTTVEIIQDISTNAAVLTDPIQIHQLIMNLCTNAYQAMTDTGGTITVSMDEVSFNPSEEEHLKLLDGDYIRLQISDTGCGMDEETLSQIFDPFFTTKEKERGTGLGLAVVYDIVRGHNGEIKVRSKPGEGTTFEIYLPVARKKMKKDTTTPDLPQQFKGNENIMIVDDEEAIRDLLSAILTHAGYMVEVYANGKEAWEQFQDKPEKWNLIITDQTMPHMTGEELAVNVMQIRPDIPIILCTGYSESVSIEKALKLGIKSYLYKPLSLDELLASVTKVLNPGHPSMH